MRCVMFGIRAVFAAPQFPKNAVKAEAIGVAVADPLEEDLLDLSTTTADKLMPVFTIPGGRASGYA